MHDLFILWSQPELSNVGFSSHANRGAVPEVLEPPMVSARDFSNPGACQTGKHSTETRTSRLSKCGARWQGISWRRRRSQVLFWNI